MNQEKKAFRQQHKTSVLLRNIMKSSEEKDQVSVGEFIAALGDRSFCLAVLVFSLPNSLPVPGIPGFSTITGLPITFIAMQMVLGRKSLWLPKKIAAKRFSSRGLAKMLAKAIPTVERLEKLLKPRWLPLTSSIGERFLGVLMVVLSLIIALPIPGGNFLPGLSMSLVALAMLERDGMFLLFAATFAIAGIIFMYEIIIGFFGWVGTHLGKLF
ncbi:MAG: exopolysaccharide biosynthesis protein [Alphaproteobacteria bacterium]